MRSDSAALHQRDDVTYEYDAMDRLTTETHSTGQLAMNDPRMGDRYAGALVPQRSAGRLLAAFAAAVCTCMFAPFALLRTTERGRRARRNRRFVAIVAAFLVPVVAVDPQAVQALHVEAQLYQAVAAGACGVTTNTIHYDYDAKGNLTQRTSGSQVTHYTYDAENRLIEVDSGAGPSSVVSYTYDADGIRTSKRVGTQLTTYVVDKNQPYAQVLEERNEAGNVQMRYVYGNDLISQTRTGSETPVTHFFHYDGQMSTRALSDADGHKASDYSYDAFGNTPGPQITAETNYLYTSEQRDGETGLYYLRARYYESTSGRFITSDPLVGNASEPISLHRYLYAQADPANRHDPSGLLSLPELNLSVAIQVILFSMNVVSFVKSSFQASRCTLKALQAFIDGSFWDGVALMALAIVNGVGAALSLIGMLAALRPPPPPLVPALAMGAGTLATSAIWTFLLNTRHLMVWVVRSLAPFAMSIFLAVSANALEPPVQRHHKIPFANSEFDFQNHDLVRTAGVDLENDTRNIMLLANHVGRHSHGYLVAVKDMLDSVWIGVAKAGAAAAREAIYGLMDDIESQIISGGLKPYSTKDVWKPPSPGG